MANNRLYIKCKCCGEILFLAKSFVDPYFLDEKSRENLNKFFEGHCFCVKPGYEHHDGGRFELFDEWDD